MGNVNYNHNMGTFMSIAPRLRLSRNVKAGDKDFYTTYMPGYRVHTPYTLTINAENSFSTEVVVAKIVEDVGGELHWRIVDA